MTDDRTWIDVARRVFRVARTEQITLVAAGVAFYAFLSLVPLALLGLAVATTVGASEVAASVTEVVGGVVTPTARELLVEATTAEEGRGGATVAGAVGLLWGGSRVLRGLDRAFSQVYGTVDAKPLADSLRDSAVVAVAISLGVLAVTGTESILAATPLGIASLVGPAFLFVALLAAFLPLYVVFPDTDVEVREALPGAALAALGWTVLGRAFAIYAGLAGSYAIYGALGAVFLVLTWLYAGSALLVLGAVLNAVLAGRDADRQLQSPGARQVRTEAMSDDATDAGSPREAGDDEPPYEAADAAGSSTTTARTRDRADDPAVLREEIERLRDELESVERDVERRTVHRDDLERDLKRYVRRRVRRGHARGWGPYLVLLYGTAMTIGAFRFLGGGWAILAMFVVWTSTLGVYLLMVLFGAGLSVLGLPGRLRDRIGDWRS